ncbi:MAG: hypothetical protein CMJ81_14140 [Planctomycetaceae bacterium]|nr:hypothetical protein [Planctomycetaceae bacterium]MBP61532.1 hypothetical protein [Planctomycetaceae bacterium]
MATTLRTQDLLSCELAQQQNSSEFLQKSPQRDPLQEIRFLKVENGKHNATFVRPLQLSFTVNKRGQLWLKDSGKRRTYGSPTCPSESSGEIGRRDQGPHIPLSALYKALEKEAARLRG